MKARVIDTWGSAIARMALVVGLAGCDSAPTAPTLQPLPPAEAVRRVYGRVLDARGTAVAGAQIAAGHVDGESETVSDASGAYALTFPPQQLNVTVYALMDGFEPSRTSVFLGLGGSAIGVLKDLRVHEIVRVTAGGSLELQIRPDDPVCTDVQDDFEWPCRRVRVLSEFAGRLTVVPTHDTPALGFGPPVQIQLPDVPYVFPPTALNVAVAAGSETIVEFLLLQRDAVRTMTVHTGLSR